MDPRPGQLRSRRVRPRGALGAVIVGLLCAAVTASVTATAASLPSPASRSPAVVRVVTGICYEPVPGERCPGGGEHRLDAYLPVRPAAAVPGVVLVHGGGWIGGDKSEYRLVGREVAASGLAGFAVNYTLASRRTPGFPTQVREVTDAVRFVRDNAARFDVDPARLAIWGDSAGANLALEEALTARIADPRASVSAAVGWSGPYDLLTVTSPRAGRWLLPAVLDYLGCGSLSSPSCRQAGTFASPVTWVWRGAPPTLLASSTAFRAKCEIVDPRQSKELAGALREAGASARLDLNGSCAHALGYADTELAATLGFLHQQLG